jgi:hypothetical protein
MSFIDMLREYMEEGSYRLCYADTDSFALTLCHDHIDECVRPQLREKYFAEIKPKWFAAECEKTPTCDDCKRSQKKPGLLKIEAKITSGWLLATSPKCYLMAANDMSRTGGGGGGNRMGDMERKIIEFGQNPPSDTFQAKRLLKEIAELELAEGDDTPYKIAKKGAKGCHSKVKLRCKIDFLEPKFGIYLVCTLIYGRFLVAKLYWPNASKSCNLQSKWTENAIA